MAPSALPNTGILYITNAFKGKELTKDDIKGVCMISEISLGLGVGGSATAMYLGMSMSSMGPDLVRISSGFLGNLIIDELGIFDDYEGSCMAVLIMTGLNIGVQAGGGFTESIGILT